MWSINLLSSSLLKSDSNISNDAQVVEGVYYKSQVSYKKNEIELAEITTLLSVALILGILINASLSYLLVHNIRVDREESRVKQEIVETSKLPEPVYEDPSKEQILARRAQIIREIEQTRGTKVITLIQRKEPWGNEGPEIEESEQILQQIRETPPDTPIDLIIHTTGTSRFNAHMIAMALSFRKSKVTAIVPYYALSNATLLTLAGDEILMEKYSILGSLEPHFGDMPAAPLMSLKTRIPVEMISDFMILLAERARMETENAKGFVKWILEKKMDPEQAERVAHFLVEGGPTSNTPITLDVVRAMGLKVANVPEKVYDLFVTMKFGEENRSTQFR